MGDGDVDTYFRTGVGQITPHRPNRIAFRGMTWLESGNAGGEKFPALDVREFRGLGSFCESHGADVEVVAPLAFLY